MKHYLRFLLTMLLLAIWGEISYGQTWQKVELKNLTSSDVFVIVDVLHNRAISNVAVSSKERPAAVSVALNEAGDRLTGVVGDNLKWKVTSNGVDYIFTSNASSNNILYWTGNSTDLKVGTLPSDAKNKEYHKFNECTSDIYTGLKTKKDTRYICNCSNQDWRCYDGPNGSYITNNKTKLAYFKYVNDTRTATNVSFGADVDGKPFYVTEGEESSFSGKIATEKDGVAGTIKYSSNNKDVVSVDETAGVVKFGKTFGTATITALFTPTDAAKYKESSASYTINYNKKERIATTLKFEPSSGSVNIGKTFTLPEPTLKAGDEVLTGRTFTYSSSAADVASIDENTGVVTIHSAGNTVLTANFVDPADVYKSSSAEFALKVIDPKTIVFSADAGSFDRLGSYSGKESTCAFVSASENSYNFKIINCTKTRIQK